jgi:hypothetical protein
MRDHPAFHACDRITSKAAGPFHCIGGLAADDPVARYVYDRAVGEVKVVPVGLALEGNSVD